ncbi:MAG: HAMP domain-containing histidine kinase [Planctomycetes bacterium]|nr:HAMP domain-containing histidine kinase [Planctomycetota bacterium]
MAMNRWSLDRLCAFVGSVSLLAAFLPVAVYLTHLVTSSAEESLVNRGGTLGQTVAAQVVEPMLLDDRLSLRNMLKRASRQDDVRYVCLEDGRGRVVACTYSGGCPPQSLVDLWRDEGGAVRYFHTERERLMDVAVPVLEGQLGRIHVGMSRARAIEAGDRLLWIMGLVLTAALSILLGGVRLVANRVGRPLRQLERAISQLPAMPSDANVSVAGGTREVDVLARGFAAMVERLRKLTREQSATQDRIVHVERLVALGELAAGLAHEIHNPLDGMLECLRYLDADTGKSVRAAKYYPLLRDGLERIARTMRQMLTFARSGQQVSSEACSVGDLLAEMELMIRPRLEGGRVRLNIHTDGTCICMCNRDGLAQAMLNLVLNAVEAAEANDQPEVRVGAACGEQWVYLIVDDNGPGVRDDLRSRIFDAFFTTKPAGKGTGLGLSVSCQIIRAIGGDIELSSEPGPLGGASFLVRLPKAISRGSDDDCARKNPDR